MIDFARKIIKYIFGKELGGETIRYIIIGGLTTLVNFVIYLIMYELLGIDANISNMTAIPASILFAYIANKLVVFKQHTDTLKALALEFFKFIGSRLFTMALELGIVALFNNVLFWNPTIGKVVAAVFVVITNYFISKLIVFRGGERDEENGGGGVGVTEESKMENGNPESE